MATPGPRYTHQSTRITKAIARPFPIRGALRKSILLPLCLSTGVNEMLDLARAVVKLDRAGIPILHEHLS
jgi:hypothetical protein